MEQLEDNHRIEVRIYIQKVKHLEYEHKNNIKRVQLDGDDAVDAEVEEHVKREVDLKAQKKSLKLEIKEHELADEQEVQRLTNQNRKNLEKTQEEFEKATAQMQERAEEQLRELRSNLELRRKVEIHEVEERKNLHINDLMRNHEKAFGQIKNYYNDITYDNLKLIKELKDEVADMKKKATNNSKLMAEISQENKKLFEPLAVTVKEVEQLKYELRDAAKDRMSLKNARARLHVLRETLKKKKAQLGSDEEEFHAVEKERDELYDTFESTVKSVQRRSEFKNLVLERKLEQLQTTFDQRQTQFGEVLRSANLDPTMVGDLTAKLDDVLDSRNTMLRDLEYDIARVTKAHNDAQRVFNEKLSAHGIEVVDEQLLPTNTGTGPAGLVATSS